MKKMNKTLRYFFSLCCLLFLVALANDAQAQIQVGDDLSEIDYARPTEYEIAGITVEGAKYVDKNALSMLSGLRVGKVVKVPGDDFATAIRNLWDQGMFEDVAINATEFVGDKVFLEIVIKERPRVSKFSFKGVKKTEADEIRDKINLSRGDVATDHLLTKTRRIIEDYYYNKGYLNADINIEQVVDTTRDSYVDMVIHVNKGPKVKIAHINFIGAENLSEGQLQAAMKETKPKGKFDPLRPLGPLVVNTIADVFTLKPLKAITGIEEYFYENYRPRIFKASKFLESNYKDDKQNIIAKYNAKGFRDARIVRDSVYKVDDRNVGIDIVIDEGNRYYYRNISWTGNTKYTAETLNEVLGIKKGDTYNKELLDKNLNYSETSLDISSLYMDDGYLFFQINPVEVRVENDSIDLEIRIHEGEQARISNVSLVGNTKTNDYVVLRELYTRPGQLFSRSDVTRTIRELATLGFFNQETITPDIKPNYSDHTVDIQYSVEEAAADQISLSAGYGYGMLMLQAGLQFNNFAIGKLFKKGAWRPVPAGDGQKLSLNITTYGLSYIMYGISFTEPWLGGRKPNSLTVSLHQSHYRTGTKGESSYGWFTMTGGSVGLGRRLTWPDDYFSLYQAISVMRYRLENYKTSYFAIGDGNGTYNKISYTFAISRNSVSQPLYPRNGSEVSLSVEVTPPYSLFVKKDYATLEDKERYKWIEMHKWNFKAVWYSELYEKLVLMTRVRFGYLGHYNSDIGPTPFHRYFLGGDGLSNYSLDSRELIGMRGYKNDALTPGYYQSTTSGGDIFTKYTLELRYPLSLNPQATIYALGFLEAGNCWLGFKNFNPFDVKRSAGVGVRIYLQMFGLLGLDWGYGFDDVYGVPASQKVNGSQFHFSIGGSID